MDATSPVVTIDGASKRFGDDVALDGVTLSVAPGTILGIIGPSGAGKTTMVRLMTGALAPTEGEIRVLGEDPRRVPAPDPRAHRLHAAVVRAVPRPDRPRERRLRRLALRHAVVAPAATDPRGPPAGRPVGGPRSPRGAVCPAGCSAGWSSRRALVHEPALALPRRTDRRHRPAPAGDDLGGARTVCATPAGRCSSRRSTSTRPRRATRSRSSPTGGSWRTGTPDDLRREAVGGDVIVIETREPIDATVLRDVPTSAGWSSAGRPTIRVDRRRRRLGDARSWSTRSRSRAARSSGTRGPAVIRRGLRRASSQRAPADRADGGHRRRSGGLMRDTRHDPRPALAVRRQGARRDLPAAGRGHQPRPRTVPDHGHLRPRVTAASGGRWTPSSWRRPGTSSRRTSGPYQELAGGGLHIVAVVQDAADARAGLRAGTIDLVVVAPADPEAQFRAGEQLGHRGPRQRRSTRSTRTTPRFLARASSDAVNRRIIERAVEEGQGYALERPTPRRPLCRRGRRRADARPS